MSTLGGLVWTKEIRVLLLTTTFSSLQPRRLAISVAMSTSKPTHSFLSLMKPNGMPWLDRPALMTLVDMTRS